MKPDFDVIGFIEIAPSTFELRRNLITYRRGPSVRSCDLKIHISSCKLCDVKLFIPQSQGLVLQSSALVQRAVIAPSTHISSHSAYIVRHTILLKLVWNISLTFLRRLSSKLRNQQPSKPDLIKMKLSTTMMLFFATVTMATPAPIILEGSLETIPAIGAGSPVEVRCVHTECPCTGWEPSSCACQGKPCNSK